MNVGRKLFGHVAPSGTRFWAPKVPAEPRVLTRDNRSGKWGRPKPSFLILNRNLDVFVERGPHLATTDKKTPPPLKKEPVIGHFWHFSSPGGSFGSNPQPPFFPPIHPSSPQNAPLPGLFAGPCAPLCCRLRGVSFVGRGGPRSQDGDQNLPVWQLGEKQGSILPLKSDPEFIFLPVLLAPILAPKGRGPSLLLPSCPLCQHQFEITSEFYPGGR